MSEPDALARTLDQAGDVGDDELAAVGGFDRAEHRRERRERILRDFRPRVRDPRQQRRLACVRESDERRVGEELQSKLDLPLLAGQADLGEARRLPARAGELLVAAAAVAALRDDDPRTGRARGRRRARRSSNTCVPTGRPSTASSPRAPFEPRPPPPPPRPARSFWFGRKPERSRRRRSATSTTSPPSPPSPPSGPPRGTYFSRRKWIEPSPPRPAMTVSRARSWNMRGTVLRTATAVRRRSRRRAKPPRSQASGQRRAWRAPGSRRC